MVTLHLWPYGDSCMTSWRRKRLESGLQMGQHSISKYKTKMGGIYVTADTFTGEKEHFSSGWNNKAGHLTWCGKSGPKWDRLLNTWLLEVANGLTIQLEAWKEKGWKIRDKAIWCKGRGLTHGSMQSVQISALYVHHHQKTSVMEEALNHRQTQWLSQVQGPSLVTTQLAWWTRAEWSRWLTEVQQQGRLFTKAHLPGLLWQVTLAQGLTTGLAEIVLELLELHCSLKTFPM